MKSKRLKKTKITAKTKISELIGNEKALEILFKEGMICIGCPRAEAETLEHACKSHGIDIKKLLKKLSK